MNKSIAISALALAIFSGSALAGRVVERPIGTIFCATEEAYLKYQKGVILKSSRDGKALCKLSPEVYRVQMVNEGKGKGAALWNFVDFKGEAYWSKSAGSSRLFKAATERPSIEETKQDLDDAMDELDRALKGFN
jgi:hypothetical protein